MEFNYLPTCSCTGNKLSCVDGKTWMKNMVGIWSFAYEKRDIRDKKVHPATYPIQLATRIIEQFTHRGELVLDPFCGSGTTLVAAQDMDRNCLGIDLKQEYVDLANRRIDNSLFCDSKQVAVCDDAHHTEKYITQKMVKLVCTSPPYADMLNIQRKNKSRRSDKRKNEQYGVVEQYSQDERDLGTMNVDTFCSQLTEIFSNIKNVMLDNGHVIINITDLWKDGHRIPLHVYVINAMEEAGYEYKNTIIWDKRKLVNGVGIFGYPSNFITLSATFEYILDFILKK